MFLDLGTLEPHEDQWAFLSTLDRLSPGDAARVARRAKRAVVGTDVAAMSRSDATRVHPPLPAVVHAELGAGLSLDAAQLTPAALSTFKHAASMANPKFYELQRLRKSTWDTPRFVRGYDLTLDDRLVLPRGLRHTVAGIVERAGSRLAVTDVRNPGREIDVAFTAELDHQAERRGQRAARPRRRRARRPARIGQDGHGLRRDRRTRHLHPGPRRPQSPGRAVAHPDRTVPRHPARPARRRPAQAHRRRGHRACCPRWPAATTSPTSPAATGTSSSTSATTSRPPRTTTRSNGSARSSGSASPPPPTRRDGLGELVTWQLGPVRHTIDPRPSQGTLAAALRRPTPDRDACCTSTTPTFRHRRRRPVRAGRARRGAPGTGRRRGTQHPDRRRRRRRPGPRAQLPRPHPTGRPRRGPHRHARRARAPGAGAAGRHDRHRPASRREPPRRRQGRRRRARHRHHTVHRRRLRRPRPRHPVPRRARSPSTACSSNAPDAWSAPHPARTSPRSTTTTTRPPRSSPPHCNAACPDTAPSASPRPDRRIRCARTRVPFPGRPERATSVEDGDRPPDSPTIPNRAGARRLSGQMIEHR